MTPTSQTGLSRRSSLYYSDAAFTLIEIMIVLTLIVVLSSLTMPKLRGFTASTRLKSSAHAIRDMLRFARDMSITERTSYLVVFDFDWNSYWLASRETFNIENPSASSITSSSSTVLQIENQQRLERKSSEAGQSMVSRTSNILGHPRSLNQNVTLSHMMTNHNFQSNQIDSGIDYIYFSPTGSSEETILHIQDQQAKLMSIIVEGATGRVHVEDLRSQQAEVIGRSTTEGTNIR